MLPPSTENFPCERSTSGGRTGMPVLRPYWMKAAILLELPTTEFRIAARNSTG